MAYAHLVRVAVALGRDIRQFWGIKPNIKEVGTGHCSSVHPAIIDDFRSCGLNILIPGQNVTVIQRKVRQDYVQDDTEHSI